MKKFLFAALFLISSFLYAQESNLVYKENIEMSEIQNLFFDLTFETLYTESIYGNEFTIEIISNNNKKTPTVVLKDKTLKIESTKLKASKGDECSVYVYIPRTFRANKAVINNSKGSLFINFLKTEEDFLITTQNASIELNETKASFMEIKTVSGNIKALHINCEYFYINSDSGNIDAALSASPIAASKITSNTGIISLNASSVDCQLVIREKNEEITKKMNAGGAVIYVETPSGILNLK